MKRAKLPPTDEATVMRQVKQALELAGVIVWRQNNMPPFTVLKRVGPGITTVRFHANPHVGIPDLGGIAPGGRIVQVEVKRKGQHATTDQVAWLNMVARAGGIAMLAYDVKQVEELMNQVRMSGWDRVESPWQP